MAFALVAPSGGGGVRAQGNGLAFEDVVAEARALASKPYVRPAVAVPNELRNVGYEQYLKIRPRPWEALWSRSDSLFQAEFFPTAFLYENAVSFIEVADGEAKPIDATPDWFDWSDSGLKPPATMPLAGFRLTYPLNSPKLDEVVAFLGASYFRPIGRGQTYGASARGLAIDTGLGRPEEFPAFRRFWLIRPTGESRDIVVWALLDTPAAAGAYAFTIKPGKRTVLTVSATLVMRHEVSLLGIAPLTSMFLSGKTAPRRDDFRPEVHDSDGLSLTTGNGERLWRPLGNPTALSIAAFGDRGPRGFGLLQRERAFDQYQDTTAGYHTRPSLWVEPLDDWGEGDVRLIEIPTDSEVHDNIVAFWAPRVPPKKGEERTWRYRLSALADEAALSPTARVVATRIAAVPDRPRQRRLMIEFAGGELDGLGARQPVMPDVSVSPGRLVDARVEALPGGSTWRLIIDVEPDGSKPAELRGFLRLRGEALTETWTYLLKP